MGQIRTVWGLSGRSGVSSSMPQGPSLRVYRVLPLRTPPSPVTDHVHASERNRFPGVLPAFRTL